MITENIIYIYIEVWAVTQAGPLIKRIKALNHNVFQNLRSVDQIHN